MKEFEFSIVLETEEDGRYTAYCPALPGCYSQGDTKEEASEMIRDAIRLHVEDRLANHEPIPTKEDIRRVRIAV